MKLKHALLGIAIAVGSLGIAGCQRDASVVSHNLSEASDMFEIDRRIVFYNGITDQYILEVVGRCSIRKDVSDQQLEVTCKTGNRTYKKHYLGVSDNVTYFAEQLESAKSSAFHYRVNFKPQSIIPNINLDVTNPVKEEILRVD